MGDADINDRSQPSDGGEPYDESGNPNEAGRMAPNGAQRSRGAREGDPDADTIMPGREYGAGQQVDDGPPA